MRGEAALVVAAAAAEAIKRRSIFSSIAFMVDTSSRKWATSSSRMLTAPLCSCTISFRTSSISCRIESITPSTAPDSCRSNLGATAETTCEARLCSSIGATVLTTASERVKMRSGCVRWRDSSTDKTCKGMEHLCQTRCGSTRSTRVHRRTCWIDVTTAATV